MPLYDYECSRCKIVKEYIYPYDMKPVGKACENCGVVNILMFPIFTKMRIGHIDQGRMRSVAFGKEFKNERDMLHYAKHHGYEPLENASVESVEKSFTDLNKIKEDEKLKKLAEGIEWTA